MTLLLVYLSGMVGWLVFHDHDPANFGNVGQELSDWTLLFYLSYVLVASFLIFNLCIGIVVNSMEGARAEEHRRERAAAAESEDPRGQPRRRRRGPNRRAARRARRAGGRAARTRT